MTDQAHRDLQSERDHAEIMLLRGAMERYGRITTAWARGMYCTRIDCLRGDVKAAIECLSEGLDGYDGTEWNGTETGTEWWERTKAEEEVSAEPQFAPGGDRDALLLRSAADFERKRVIDLKAMLSTLIDRTEGSSVLTDDERDEYRQRAGLTS